MREYIEKAFKRGNKKGDRKQKTELCASLTIELFEEIHEKASQTLTKNQA